MQLCGHYYTVQLFILRLLYGCNINIWCYFLSPPCNHLLCRFKISPASYFVNASESPREVMKIYSKFLEGSNRHGRELVLIEPKQMRAIRDALRRKRDCLYSVELVLMSFSDDIEGNLLIYIIKVIILSFQELQLLEYLKKLNLILII